MILVTADCNWMTANLTLPIREGLPTNQELSCYLRRYQAQGKQECQLSISLDRGLSPFTVATT